MGHIWILIWDTMHHMLPYTASLLSFLWERYVFHKNPAANVDMTLAFLMFHIRL